MSRYTRAQLRCKRTRAIRHKLNVIRHVMCWSPRCREFVQSGRLSKKNLSCSCDMCRVKTRERGPNIRDIRKAAREIGSFADIPWIEYIQD